MASPFTSKSIYNYRSTMMGFVPTQPNNGRTCFANSPMQCNMQQHPFHKSRFSPLHASKPILGTSSLPLSMIENEHIDNESNKSSRNYPLASDSLNPSVLMKRMNTDRRCDAKIDPSEQSCIHRRQFLLASTLLLSTQLSLSLPANAANDEPLLAKKNNFEQSPINKRSGITLSEPERIYPLSFVTYLSRFLLVFDDECQQWWYTQAQAIPSKSSKEEVNSLRLRQFGKFAASVEVGLMDYEGKDGEGAKDLLETLVRRYGGVLGSIEDRDGAISSSLSASSLWSMSKSDDTAEIRKSKEALRQIALLFSTLENSQPVDSITQLLAAIDDAKIERVQILDGGKGYPPPGYSENSGSANAQSDSSFPKVIFPDPPTTGTVFGGSAAKGKVIMKESGRVLKVDLLDVGSGYINPPSVEINIVGSDPVTDSSKKFRNRKSLATAEAYLGTGSKKGTIERIEIVEPGMGYTALDKIAVFISPPETWVGQTASAKAVLEYEVIDIEITDGGIGYAAEKPIRILIDPPPDSVGNYVGGGRSAVATAYPKGKYTSYYANFQETDDKIYFQRTAPDVENIVSASERYSNTARSLVTGPASNQLLSLLPSGYGVQYDKSLQRYILETASSDNWEDILAGTLEGKSLRPIKTQFGPRGRSPIESERSLGELSTVLRFMASGAVSSSIAHLILTPIDVVKTKVQTDGDNYNTGIGGAFRKVWEEEGPATFFDGWEPTFVGFFFSGSISFFLTELFRRYYTSFAMTVMMEQSSMSAVSASAAVSSFEIPLIVAGAATAAFCCCFVLAPFDSIRIRRVSQPDYAENIVGVVSRMIQEEGLLSLFSTVPVWFLKEIPFNAAKFLTFDTTSEFLYETFPVAREDIRLFLAVSLVSGTLAGIVASVVSNPADVVVSELKKAKTDISAIDAFKRLKERGGVPAFFKGLSLRMIFYALLVSVQFLLYDTVRFSLGVGSDDMKLYLNVLGEALKNK